MDDLLNIKLWYKGDFESKPEFLFVGGENMEVEFSVDGFGYFTLVGFAKEVLGYKDDVKLHYRVPEMNLKEGLRLIHDDKAAMEIVQLSRQCQQIEVFCEGEIVLANMKHVADVDKDEVVGDDTTVVDKDNDEGDDVTVVDKDKNIAESEALGDVRSDDDDGQDDSDSMDSNCNEDNLDDRMIDVPLLSDQDEEELVQSRKKVKQFRKEKTIVGVAGGKKGKDCDFASGSGKKMVANLEETDSGSDSEYFDSSDPGSYYTASDHDDDGQKQKSVRRKSKHIHFDEKNSVPEFEVGMIFDSPEQFRKAITKYSVARKCELTFVKNERNRLRVKCVDGCPWLVLVSTASRIGSLMVKTFHKEHTCSQSFRNKRVTATFLAEYFKDRIRSQPKIKLLDLKRICKSELKVDVTLVQCKRAKRKVMTEVQGNYKEEYARLWDYAEEIRRTNSGSTVVIKHDRPSPQSKPIFQRIYVCFDACKKGWLAGCRRIIGLDGCFLKTVCRGELLSAIGRDGNNQMFPIAWAVVECENKASWRWFLEILMYDLGYKDGLGLTIISDKQKGLIPALNELLPHVEHRMCARHIYANWCKDHRGSELKNLFWQCAKSRTFADYDENISVLKEKNASAYDDLLKTDPSHWCKAFFQETSKCDIVDNNLSETFNGWILEARHKAIRSMLDDIRLAVMRRLHSKRDEASKWNGDIAPRIVTKLTKNKELSCSCYVEWNGDEGYEIKDELKGEGHVVHLRPWTCSCKEWDLTGIPCPHAICAITFNKGRVEDYIDTWYRKDTYLTAYQHMMQPMKCPKFWAKMCSEELQPPRYQKMPGRPKKLRRKDPHETKKVGTLSRHGRVMKCSICGIEGHNKKGCKAVRPSSDASQCSQARNNHRDVAVEDERGKSKETQRDNRKRKRLVGVGLYVNEQTGVSILNPGRRNSRLIAATRRGSQGCLNSTQGSNN